MHILCEELAKSCCAVVWCLDV